MGSDRHYHPRRRRAVESMPGPGDIIRAGGALCVAEISLEGVSFYRGKGARCSLLRRCRKYS
jgi:hypothetical protein